MITHLKADVRRVLSLCVSVSLCLALGIRLAAAQKVSLVPVTPAGAHALDLTVKIEADYILACQIMNHPTYPQANGAINNVRGYNPGYPQPDYIVPGENAVAIMGLLAASDYMGSNVYRQRAQLAAHYFISVQNADGSWYNKYDYVNGHDFGKFSRHTAELMMAFHKLGYDANRYNAMQSAANYLITRFNSVFNLIDGGLDSQGLPITDFWLTDNCFAYHAFMAAYDWAEMSGNHALAMQYADYAGKIVEGINANFEDVNTPVWYMRLDSSGQPVENTQYPSWIKYAPQLYNVPVKRLDNEDVGEWIKTSFQQADGSCIGYEYDSQGNKTNTRKYPGHSFQSALCWQRIGGAQLDYAKAAKQWAKRSGLWQLQPDSVGVRGGWIDWIEVEPNAGAMPQDWERYIDTSALAIMTYTGGYDFSVATFTIHVPQDYATIQEAIDAAWDSCTIMVADGTYKGTGNVNLVFNGKKIHLTSEHGAQHTVIDCEHISGQRGFYFSYPQEKFATVEGFTIMNGQAVWPHNAGGGVYSIAEASPTIKDCVFVGNRAQNGGAIYLANNNSSLISGCTFENNEAYWSSAGVGGAIMCSMHADPTIENCSFVDNNAETKGGGIACVMLSSPQITNSTFVGNNAGSAGGVVYCDESSPIFTDSTFTGNTAGNAGAAVFCDTPSSVQNTTPVFTNCLFAHNIVSNSNSDAGAIYCIYAQPSFYSCTFTGNVSGRKGAALYCNDPYPVLRDCIVWGNSPSTEQIYVFYAGDCDVTYSDVELGYPGTGNIDADPLFASGTQGNYYLSQIAAGQTQESPCVDAGSDSAEHIGLDQQTTRTDHVADSAIIDMGYHYPIP